MKRSTLIVIVLSALIVAVLLSRGACRPRGLTIEQIVQRRIADVSSKPYIDKRLEQEAEVLAVFDDIPDSQLVRVVVRRIDDRMILGVLSTKHTQLAPGQQVQLVSIEYKQTEFHITGIFYIKE